MLEVIRLPTLSAKLSSPSYVESSVQKIDQQSYGDVLQDRAVVWIIKNCDNVISRKIDNKRSGVLDHCVIYIGMDI